MTDTYICLSLAHGPQSALKAGSQSDARPCVALIRETHKFITKKVGDFLTLRRKNATQGSARIEHESILASYWMNCACAVLYYDAMNIIKILVGMAATQEHVTVFSVWEGALTSSRWLKMAGPDQGEKKIGFKTVILFKDQTLGIGSYGAVCRAKCDDLLCAAKIIHPTLFNPTALHQIAPHREHRLESPHGPTNSLRGLLVKLIVAPCCQE